MYKVTFELEGKLFKLLAKDVDMMYHPYFVCVSGFEFARKSTIVNPDNESAEKRFKDVERIFVPSASMKIVEEISEEEAQVSTLRAVE